MTRGHCPATPEPEPRAGKHAVADDDDNLSLFLCSAPFAAFVVVLFDDLVMSQSTSSTVSIPQSAPAGSLTITKPPQTATSYFKIAPSNTITFGWNFTDVLSTPNHLTVSAVGDNGNTYPVGPTDGVIPGTATEVTWDLWSYQQAHSNLPLAPGSYVLHIWDDRGPGAARSPGLLQENSALQFALYTPLPYTPLQSTCCPHSLFIHQA